MTTVAIIGGGPAGLMAAEVVSEAGRVEGFGVDLYDAMPSVGRKFLMAGKGGLNLSHAEPREQFMNRYGDRRKFVEPWLAAFGVDELRAWARDLGVETYVGSSGRIFPTDMKAAPLLRSWLHRLRANGVKFHARHRWLGWNEAGELRFATPNGEATVHADAVVLALGGGSWAKLGSDGAWVPVLEAAGVAVAPLKPANCGFDVVWSSFFRDKFAGQPVKSVTASIGGLGEEYRRRGEFVVTEHGVEGGLVYSLSAPLREAIEAEGHADLEIDLLPDKSVDQVRGEVERPRGSRSLSSHLQSRLGLKGVKVGLLHECASREDIGVPPRLTFLLKGLKLRLVAPRPLDEAISSAGGVRFTGEDGLDEHLMLRARPGVFCAGEMLDWEAPTGGYLLTACFASGRAAGQGVLAWLSRVRRL
ncbi:MAG: TIGR03862 family flavoprotein [Gammaproteobacteria bacterium]|nr:TIGR03862 family flavoprotein [Gammaproteobacteria bacterium]MBU1414281.1 TIGR03862 family flavoprotein [Gammaproteobacteria bacterium]